MADQSITAYNPLPQQTANSDTVALRVFRDECNSGRDHTSETGKRQIGLVDPADASCELVPELDPVVAGAVQIPLEQLVTGYNGSCQLALQDLNMVGAELANGTTLKVEDTFPETAVEGTIAAGSTKDKIVLTAAPAEFVDKVGQSILIATADNVTPMRNHIRKVVNDGDNSIFEIHTAFPMDEVPHEGGKVQLLKGFKQDLGGNTMGLHELTMAMDFGKGAKYRTIIHRARFVGGLKQTVAKGKVKTSLNANIEGHAKVSGGRLQIIPMSREGEYGLATV